MAGGLKLIEAEMKALIAAKQKLRKLIAQVGRDITANAAPTDERPPLNFQIGMGSQQAYREAQMPFADPESEAG